MEEKPKVIIIDNNPLSIASYLEDHPDITLEEEKSCATCVYRYFEEPDPCLDCFDCDNDDGIRKNWKWDGIGRKKQSPNLSEHDRETVEKTTIAILKGAVSHSPMEGGEK